jgi:hypothetical protein
MEIFNSPHTSEAMSKSGAALMQKWGIDKAKCAGFTTDSASNMLKAARTLGVSIRCALHILARIFDDCLTANPGLATIFAEIRSSVSELKKEGVSVKKDVPTRKFFILPIKKFQGWNSTHAMVKSFAAKKTEYLDFKEKHTEHKEPTYSFDELTEYLNLMTILATKTNDYFSPSKMVSDVIPDLVELRSDFHLYQDKLTGTTPKIIAIRAKVKEMKNALVDSCTKRMNSLLYESVYAKSMLLDPRWTNMT